MYIKKYSFVIKNTSGQLLIELLISLFVGGLFLIGATVGVTSIMRYNFETRGNQTASGFAKDLLDTAVLTAHSDWGSLYAVSKDSSAHYFFAPDASSTAIVLGNESVLFNDVRAGLWGQWKFDEASGDGAYDSSGNGLYATTTNVTRVAADTCVFGQCFDFNGSTSYVDVGTSTVFATTSSLTVAAWIQTLSTNATTIIDNKAGAYDGYTLQQDLSDPTHVSFSVADSFSNETLVGSTTINDGQWHFVVGTFSEGMLSLYVDGLFDASTTASFSDITPPTQHLRIGSTALGDMSFDGYLDDVRVYGRALSHAEIQDIYNSPLYYRYVTIDNVDRDGWGDVVVSGTEDPSTQKITAWVSWEGGRSMQLYRYVMRNATASLSYTTWSGCPGIDGPVTSATSTFATSSNITYSSDSYLVLATTTTGGWLESAIFDTQVPSGGAVHSIVWQGTQPSGTIVRFQLAASNNAMGPWNYGGSDGSGTTYFTTATNVSVPVMNVNNYRYVRYKVFLEPNAGSSPTVDDIMINWSR